MEDHRQMALHVVHKIKEVLAGEAFGDDPIELFPQDHRATRLISKRREACF